MVIDTSCLRKKPEINVADIVRLAEVSATSGVQYIRPEEVRSMLVKIGFELTEPQPRQKPETVEETM